MASSSVLVRSGQISQLFQHSLGKVCPEIPWEQHNHASESALHGLVCGVTEGVVYWAGLKQRYESGKSSWEQQSWQPWGRYWCALCLFSPTLAFWFYCQLENYGRNHDWLWGGVGLCVASSGGWQLLSCQGEINAVTSMSKRNVFPLGGAPFWGLYQLLRPNRSAVCLGSHSSGS